MPKQSSGLPLLPLIAFPFLILFSCNSVQQVPPLSEFTAYPQPSTIPLELTEPVPIHWDTLGKGNIHPTTFHLDLNQLPSQPYDPDGFQPLPSAPITTTLQITESSYKPFDLEKIPEQPLEMTITPLPLPSQYISYQKPFRVMKTTLDMSEWTQIRSLGVTVTGMVESSAGMLFIGTSNGIYQFDGTRLINIISKGQIYGLTLDKEGDLWYAQDETFNTTSICRINFKEKTLESCSVPLILNVRKFITDSEGYIWIPGSSNMSPIIIDPIALTYRKLEGENGLKILNNYEIFQDGDNRTWLCSHSGIYIIDRDKKRFLHLAKDNGLLSDTVTSLTGGANGRVWAAGFKGLYGIDLKNESIVHYSWQAKENDRAFTMYSNKSGLLWIGTFKEIVIVDTRGNAIRYINTGTGAAETPVINIIEDKRGRVLFTVFAPGTIYIVGQMGKTIYPLKDTDIISVIEDSKGNLWVGTGNEVRIVDSARRRISRLEVSNGLADNFIQSITEEAGKILITTSNGFNIFDPDKKEMIRVGKKEGLITDTTYSMIEDNIGNLWTTGTFDGIVKYEKNGNSILRLNTEGGLNGDLVVQALPLDDHKIIINSFESGPCIIDQLKNTVQFIRNPSAINASALKTLTKDTKGRFWIAGDNNWGIYAIDLHNKTLTYFSTKEGLSSNTSNSILEYNGKMVACMSHKVNIITPPELSETHQWEINVLKYTDDFIKSTNTFTSDAVTARGSYIIGDKGLKIFNRIIADSTPGFDYISNMRIMGKEAVFTRTDRNQGDSSENKLKVFSSSDHIVKGAIFWDSLSGPFQMPVNLSLPFDQNIVQFQFTELGTGRTDSLHFAYALEGLDKYWTFTNNIQSETYLNLSPGSYLFKVSSRRINGSWNTPATFSFTIRPPWYFTWWAYCIYGLLFLLLVYALNRIQKRRVLAKERQRTQIREAQLKADGENERRKNIELISEMGKDITSSLSIKNIINTVYSHVNKLMDAAIFGIGIFNKETQQLEFPATIENGEILSPYHYNINDMKRPANWCFKNRKEIMMNDFEKEHRTYISDIPETAAGKDACSLIYLPLIYKDKSIGVLTAQSFNKNAYDENHLNILRSLATYTSVALDNAEAYRNLQSAQSKLIQSEKMASLGELTAGIAHEIQNPLNFVNNFSEVNMDLIKEMNEEIENGNFGEVKELAAHITHNEEKIIFHGKRADSIVKSMLQHSRNSSGNKEHTDINNLCDECLRLAFHGMRARDKSFNSGMETDFDPEIKKINVVPQDMGRVLLNLLTNAFYEVNEKRKTNLNDFHPMVKIGTKKCANSIQIEVSDNGNGFSQKVKEKILQPFFTTKPTGKGTGLGLSLSYDIVRAHGGNIEIAAEEGKGATFTIQIPTASN